MFYGKSRGQGRKYKRLLKYIAEIEPYIDKEEIEEWGYEHFHVPCPVWLDMPRTSSKIKTAFCILFWRISIVQGYTVRDQIP